MDIFNCDVYNDSVVNYSILPAISSKSNTEFGDFSNVVLAHTHIKTFDRSNISTNISIYQTKQNNFLFDWCFISSSKRLNSLFIYTIDNDIMNIHRVWRSRNLNPLAPLYLISEYYLTKYELINLKYNDIQIIEWCQKNNHGILSNDDKISIYPSNNESKTKIWTT